MDELDTDPEPIPPATWTVGMDGDDGAILTIGGELDIGNVDELDAEMAPVLAAHPPRLVVDVTALRFADSSAIALWVRWAAAVERFELRHPSPILQRVIAAMGLGPVLGPQP
jgi:anti-anti-sigma factor